MEEIEIRSDEVQDILSHVPHWMIRWGITVIFGLIVLLLGLAWFVRYPEMVDGSVIITTEKAPIKLTAQGNGILKSIRFKDGETVQEGEVVATLQNPMDEETMLLLTHLIDTFQLHKDSLVAGRYEFPNNLPNFGALQEPVNSFRTIAEEYFTWVQNTYNKERIENLNAQIEYHQQLSSIYTNQKRIAEKELANAKKKLDTDKKLVDKGVISNVEFLEEQSKYNQKEQALEQLKTAFVQNNITVTNLEKQLLELNFEQDEKMRELNQQLTATISQLKNELKGWQQNYLIKAPYSGKINYLSKVDENEYVTMGSPLFAVLPEENPLVGYVELPTSGIGRVEIGQRVNIQLDNYPAHEFGQLKGEVVSISEVPMIHPETKQGNYLVTIGLTDGLTTTYKKEVNFTAEMLGTASVVTKDRSVLERIFDQFRALFDK